MKNFKQSSLLIATLHHLSKHKKMKTKIKALMILVSCAFIFQSCLKNSQHVPNPFREDKLLLSKVSGHFQDDYYWGLNNFMYNPSGNFLETYSYGNESFYGVKPIQQIGFVNTGTWDFTYNH